MTCLEHLIENCLHHMSSKSNSYDEIISLIKSDDNYESADITADQCYEICSYITYIYLPAKLDEE